ncbi:MAG TPA: tRNA dihydrouridine synthase DusB [Alphaproteobacteria bacterium]|jgi:tRNA-dihydrouridine synthase B|nr:tRNA dihydrouridine synthase DusB [Alphaproteobacteria bacterium]
MSETGHLAPIDVGPVRIAEPVMLAPMSGISDLPFRRLVKRQGAGLVVSEMIASQALVRNSRKTLRMLSSCAEEFPMAVQLAGCEPTVMAEAARFNADRGAAIIDINMGCPVKKVVRGEAGSALMRDPALAGRIIAAVVAAVELPVTLKIRTGWDENSRNAPELARIAEDLGVRMVVVHGRTRQQMFSGSADWRFISQVKKAVTIPVIANGDVRSFDDARDILRQSGADGLMIGRGCYGKPWMPAHIGHFLRTGKRSAPPPLTEQRAILLEHFEAVLEHYGDDIGVRTARKHIGWYTKGLPGSAAFRAEVNGRADSATVRRLISDYFGRLLDRRAA